MIFWGVIFVLSDFCVLKDDIIHLENSQIEVINTFKYLFLSVVEFRGGITFLLQLLFYMYKY